MEMIPLSFCVSILGFCVAGVALLLVAVVRSQSKTNDRVHDRIMDNFKLIESLTAVSVEQVAEIDRLNKEMIKLRVDAAAKARKGGLPASGKAI